MTLRRLGLGIVLVALALNAGCCWWHHHGHRCCYTPPAAGAPGGP